MLNSYAYCPTTDDYKSCLMVLDQFLTKDKITLFEKRLNEEDANYRRQHLRFLEALQI
jgi:hypothetical protein